MKQLILICLILGAFSLSAQAQSSPFYTPKKTTPVAHFNDFNAVPLADLSFYKLKEGKGIPPALLIIGGAGMFLLGTATPVNGSGYFQKLMIAGGLGSIITGTVIAFRNVTNDKWE